MTDIQNILIHKCACDAQFMGAMFYAGLANNDSIRKIVDALLSAGYDDNLLISIAASYNDYDIAADFDRYLADTGLKPGNPKQIVAAKTFYYILENELDFWETMEYLFYSLYDFEHKEDFDHILLDFKYVLEEYKDDEILDYPAEISSVLNNMKEYILKYLGAAPNEGKANIVRARLAQIYQKNIDAINGQPAKIDIAKFDTFHLLSESWSYCINAIKSIFS